MSTITSLRRSNPEWYPIIEQKAKRHIGFLVNQYKIQSCTVQDVFNVTVSNMIQVERRGNTIRHPLAYSKQVAQNLVIKIQRTEYRERAKELAIQRALHDELRTDTALIYGDLLEEQDALCHLLHAFRARYPEQYKLLLMKDVEKLGYREISNRLYGTDHENAYNATRQAYSRAFRRFRSFVQDYWR